MDALVLEKNGRIVHKAHRRPSGNGNDMILVRVKVAGVCSSDIPRAFRNGAYHYPLILGHEIFGTTYEQIPRRAVIYPLISCRACTQCRKGNQNLCAQYDYLGSRTHGGFAEYVQAPQENIFEVPEGMNAVSAVLTEPLAVVIHAFHKAAPQKSDKILIVGDGSMGLLLSRFLVQRRFKSVSLLGVHAHKLSRAEQFGASPILAVNRLLPQNYQGKFNVVFELAGTNSAYQSSILGLQAQGKLALIGNAREDIFLPKNVFAQILRKETLVSGSWNSVAKDWKEALAFLASDSEISSVITHQVSLKKAPVLLKQIYRCALPDYIKAAFLV
ncbi:MAG: hypothetical protein G01um101466_817 [Parcubacteria group bacterium Gr01-1014_66]|nr:MAG: hypothetical protein G01um101466_817 [Parcubacteria group bacterium Gr01-1014_66]